MGRVAHRHGPDPAGVGQFARQLHGGAAGVVAEGVIGVEQGGGRAAPGHRHRRARVDPPRRDGARVVGVEVDAVGVHAAQRRLHQRGHDVASRLLGHAAHGQALRRAAAPAPTSQTASSTASQVAPLARLRLTASTTAVDTSASPKVGRFPASASERDLAAADRRYVGRERG